MELPPRLTAAQAVEIARRVIGREHGVPKDVFAMTVWDEDRGQIHWHVLFDVNGRPTPVIIDDASGECLAVLR